MRPNSSPYSILLAFPYAQMRSNSSSYSTFLTILPNDAQQFTLYYFLDHTPTWGPTVYHILYHFSDHTPKWDPTVHPIVIFWPCSQMRLKSSPCTTFRTILLNDVQQFTLYYFSDHILKWGPTVHQILLFWPYSQMRLTSSPYTTFLTILPNEAQDCAPYTTFSTILKQKLFNSFNYYYSATTKFCFQRPDELKNPPSSLEDIAQK